MSNRASIVAAIRFMEDMPIPEDISMFLLVGLATGLVMVMTVQPIWG